MICVQRRHSETEHLRPIPGRRDVRHSDSPFGARPLYWARNRWAHDEPNANAKRGPPPFEPLIAPRGDTAARPTTPKQRRHACVGSAWRVRSRLDCAVSLPVTPGVYSAEKCVICRETDMAVRSHIFAYRYGFVVACAPLLLSVEPSSSDVVGDVLICNESATLHGSMSHVSHVAAYVPCAHATPGDHSGDRLRGTRLNFARRHVGRRCRQGGALYHNSWRYCSLRSSRRDDTLLGRLRHCGHEF